MCAICKELDEMDFDFVDHVVVYARKYTSGYTFAKDAFKTESEQIVPIVHGADPNVCLGGAILEHREDGVVAKCRFGKDLAGETAAKLITEATCGLGFLAIPVKRDGDIIRSGTIRAVLFLDKNDTPRLVED